MKVWILASVLLLAGCAGPAGDDGSGGSSSSNTQTNAPGNPGFAPQGGTATGMNHSVRIDVNWTTCANGFCANATATNTGATPYFISSICESPWFDRMSKDGKSVPHREPMFICLAYGRETFGPGAKSETSFQWNGTLWNDTKGVHEPAPQGAYSWSLVFWFESSPSSPRMEANATFTIVVGPT